MSRQQQLPFKSAKKRTNQLSRRGRKRKRQSFNGDPTDQFISLQEFSYSREITNDIASLNFPSSVVDWFYKRGVTELFDWQVECLKQSTVLNGGNLVFSAPTSAGKTMIADIVMFKQAFECKRKSILILPYVSVTREKTLTLQSMFAGTGIRIGGFMGGIQPPGGFDAIDIAICTIEKANSLINKLIEEKKLCRLATIVIDEMHLLGDPSRGHQLEYILSKLIYICRRKPNWMSENYQIQLIGLSATLPNVEKFAEWLDAKLYITEFRPVKLTEKLKVGEIIYNSSGEEIEKFEKKFIIPQKITDTNDVIHLVLETVVNKHGTLIFCPRKKECEDLAAKIAIVIKELGRNNTKQNEDEVSLRDTLRSVFCEKDIREIIDRLEKLPFNVEDALYKAVKFGTAYHHAGLSNEERDIIEDGFRKGVIKVLVATTTLCSGVNLPARRVIINSPLDCFNQKLDVSTYKQMTGRAGRKGIDSEGESFLICDEKQKDIGLDLIKSNLTSVNSCLMFGNKLSKAILEVITLKIASTKNDLKSFIECTFLFHCEKDYSDHLKNTLNFLKEYRFICSIGDKFFPTKLANAVVASAISPADGCDFVKELDKARMGLILKNDLHLLYYIIPRRLSHTLDTDHWKNFSQIWDKLSSDFQSVGKAVGIKEHVLNEGFCSYSLEKTFGQDVIDIHRRFYTALALNDIIQETPLHEVVKKYRIPKGTLQTLQHNVGTFASMVTVFCNKLGWSNLEILIDQFHSRLHFGVQRQLIDLMKISSVNSGIARCLYNSGYDTVASIAQSSFEKLYEAIRNFEPFQAEMETPRKIWISGRCCAMDAEQIARTTLDEARNIIEKSLGISMKWDEEEVAHISAVYEQKDIEFVFSNNEKNSNHKSVEKLEMGDSVNKFAPLPIFESPHFKSVLNRLESCDDSGRELFLDRTPENFMLESESETSHLSNEDADEMQKHNDCTILKSNRKINETSNHCPLMTNDEVAKNLASSLIFRKNLNIVKVNNEDQIEIFIQRMKHSSSLTILFECERIASKSLKPIGGRYLNEDDDKGILYDRDELLLKQLAIHLDNEFNDVYNFCDPQTLKCLKQKLRQELFFEKEIRTFDAIATLKMLKQCFDYEYHHISSLKWFDVKLGYWMIAPEQNTSIETIFENCFNSLYSLLKSKADSFININDSKKKLPFLCFCLSAVCKVIKNDLFGQKLYSVFENCEIPFLFNMNEMIINGVGFDKEYFRAAKEEWILLLRELQEKAYEIAGHSFNLNSAKDVAYVLYREKDLLSKYYHLIDAKKRHCRFAENGKPLLSKNLSTAKSVLAKFSAYDELAAIILKWRKLHSMIEKCVNPISSKIHFDDQLTHMYRVSGEFGFYTATGRIIMHNPNLLAIHKDFDASVSATNSRIVSLRKAFIPRKGYCFVSADFKQLELRILAFLSKDPFLTKELDNDIDVFNCIASKIKSKAVSDVTAEERQQAKDICYGIIYGLGNEELAKKLGVVEEEADEFREQFFNSFPYVKKFKEDIIADCKSTGFVKTIDGRKRCLPDINNFRSISRSKAERQAFNTYIQGSASYLMKKFLIYINNQIREMNLNAALVLSIHDEFLYEINETHVHDFKNLIANKQFDQDFNINLPIKLRKGMNWSELHEF